MAWRKRAESANVLVTNHSLFFCDLAAEGFLLPPTRYWVVDEAHGAEAEARRALAVKLDAAEIVRLANRLAATDAKRNPFVRLERRAPMNEATMPEASSLFYGLTEKAAKAGRAFSDDAIAFSHHMKDLVACDTNRQNRNYENIELWINDEVRTSQQFAGLREYGKKFQEIGRKTRRRGERARRIPRRRRRCCRCAARCCHGSHRYEGHAASVRPYSE